MTERPSDLLILALRPGDTLIVHLPKPPDARYAEDVKAAIRRQLSFDVPIIVVGPGVTFEVARPVSEPAKAFCVTCGNLHATEAHEQCAANEARGLHADGVDPATCEHGRTAAHTTDCYCIANMPCEHDCPGPVDG